MNRIFACVRVLPSDRHFHTPPNAPCSAHQHLPRLRSPAVRLHFPGDKRAPRSPGPHLTTRAPRYEEASGPPPPSSPLPPPPAVGAAGRTAPGRRDVGVLPDIAAPHAGHGRRHAPLLRRPRRAALRRRHRRIRMVLLPLHHHPRPRRHLDDINWQCKGWHWILLELVLLEHIYPNMGCSSYYRGL